MDCTDAWWQAAVAVAPRGTLPLTTARTRRLGWLMTHDDLLAAGDPIGVLAARQGFVLDQRQLRGLGVSDSERRRRLRSGAWTAPRRGVVCPLPPDRDGRPGNRSPEILVAAVALGRPAAVVSHQSAALLQGLRTLRGTPRVRLTTASVSRAGGWPGCHVHAAALPPAECAAWFGVPLTSAARTIIDIARHDGEAAGLVVADSGLVEGVVTIGQIHDSVRRARRRPGVVTAARVADLAVPGAESPLETLTRLCLVTGGISEPLELQAPIETSRGTFRVDLLLTQRGVIVEADGRSKYEAHGALWREKLRQEALERAGYTVVRVTWDDVVRHPTETVLRVRRARPRTLATF